MNRGINIVLASNNYPSTKTCSWCGNKLDDITLDDRTYWCPNCGLIIDRDFNAARNLEKLAS